MMRGCALRQRRRVVSYIQAAAQHELRPTFDTVRTLSLGLGHHLGARLSLHTHQLAQNRQSVGSNKVFERLNSTGGLGGSGSWHGAVGGGSSFGSRRRMGFWTRHGGDSGRKSSDSTADEGFTETPAPEGDSWTPPPDAWRPDATVEDPQASSMSGFDVGGGFSETAAETVAAASPDAATAMNAALSAADLGNYPSHVAMKIIEFVQASAGVPYWQAIIITSIAAKFAVLPAVTGFQGMAKRMGVAKPEIDELQARMADIKARVEANPEVREVAMQEMVAITHEMQAVLRAHRVSHPKMLLLMFGQAPVFISLFLATREMGLYYPGFATGGMDWMLDLGAPDPTYVLPVLTATSMMILMEFGSDTPPPQQSGTKPKVDMKNIFRAMGIIFVPVAFTMPAGVLIYWTTTNIFGLFQRALFQSSAVQRFLGWPLPEDMPAATKPRAEVPTEAEFASKEDLERWGGGGAGASSEAARHAAEAAERAREAVAKASKTRHEDLKRDFAARSGETSRKDGSDNTKDGDGRQF